MHIYEKVRHHTTKKLMSIHPGPVLRTRDWHKHALLIQYPLKRLMTSATSGSIYDKQVALAGRYAFGYPSAFGFIARIPRNAQSRRDWNDPRYTKTHHAHHHKQLVFESHEEKAPVDDMQ